MAVDFGRQSRLGEAVHSFVALAVSLFREEASLAVRPTEFGDRARRPSAAAANPWPDVLRCEM